MNIYLNGDLLWHCLNTKLIKNWTFIGSDNWNQIIGCMAFYEKTEFCHCTIQGCSMSQRKGEIYNGILAKQNQFISDTKKLPHHYLSLKINIKASGYSYSKFQESLMSLNHLFKMSMYKEPSALQIRYCCKSLNANMETAMRRKF